jgi:hypothetical protein
VCRLRERVLGTEHRVRGSDRELLGRKHVVWHVGWAL